MPNILVLTFVRRFTYSPQTEAMLSGKSNSLTNYSQYYSEANILQSSFLHYTYDTATHYAFSILRTRLPVTNVTIHDLVRLTLLPQLTSSLDGRFGAVLL